MIVHHKKWKTEHNKLLKNMRVKRREDEAKDTETQVRHIVVETGNHYRSLTGAGETDEEGTFSKIKQLHQLGFRLDVKRLF